MSDQFLAELRMFPYAFAPVGWAMCNGQTLPIAQNTALFALLGATYGGDGKSTFALPDLRGRVTVHQGDAPALTDYDLGESGGQAAVQLAQLHLPRHSHTLSVSGEVATEREPPGQLLATGVGVNFYDTQAPGASMDDDALADAGGVTQHNNMQPFTTLLWCIAVVGTFPTRP